MTGDILAVLRAGGLQTEDLLAERLGLSPEMLRARLERYEMLGYVRKVRLTADGASRCGSCGRCAQGKRALFTYWELTDKA